MVEQKFPETMNGVPGENNQLMNVSCIQTIYSDTRATMKFVAALVVGCICNIRFNALYPVCKTILE